MTNRIRKYLYTLFLVNFLDFLTTVINVSLAGLEVEFNPIMRYCLNTPHMWLFLVAKLAIFPVIIYGMITYALSNSEGYKPIKITLIVMILFFTFVVLNNFSWVIWLLITKGLV